VNPVAKRQSGNSNAWVAEMEEKLGKRFRDSPGNILLNGADMSVIMQLNGNQAGLNQEVANKMVTDGVLKFNPVQKRYYLTIGWKTVLG